MKSLGATTLFRCGLSGNHGVLISLLTKPKSFEKNRKWLSDTFIKLSAEPESTINSADLYLIEKMVKNALTTGLFEIDHESYE